jgi:hypothetical protein
MARQQAIYDQNCRLIVSRQVYVLRTHLMSIFISRILVRPFAFPLKQSHSCALSRPVGIEQLPPRSWGRIWGEHGDRKGCLRSTRETVLNEIESWTKDFNESPVFWLNGLAGTGKSTIAQTVSERIFADGLLGASFFCSRDFEDRSDLHLIFPTLAFQLAHKYPEISIRSRPPPPVKSGCRA